MDIHKKILMDAHKACGLKIGDKVEVIFLDGTRTGWVGFITENLIDAFAVQQANSVNMEILPYYMLEKITDRWNTSGKFKPFDKVLVRNDSAEVWRPALYGYYDKCGKLYDHYTTAGWVMYCISYEGNEHLAGRVE